MMDETRYYAVFKRGQLVSVPRTSKTEAYEDALSRGYVYELSADFEGWHDGVEIKEIKR